MLTIAEFSVLSQISIYMLRHYDEIGLLIPEQVDEFTGTDIIVKGSYQLRERYRH